MNDKAIWVIVFGAILVLYSLSMDTTVASGYGRVHNLSKASHQQNLLILGGFVFIAGIILFSLYRLKQTPEKELEENKEEEAKAAELSEKFDHAKETVITGTQEILHSISPSKDNLLWRSFVGLYVGVCNFSFPFIFSTWLLEIKPEAKIQSLMGFFVLLGFIGFVASLIYSFARLPAFQVMKHLLILNISLSAGLCLLWVLGAGVYSGTMMIVGLIICSIPIAISSVLIKIVNKSKKLNAPNGSLAMGEAQ